MRLSPWLSGFHQVSDCADKDFSTEKKLPNQTQKKREEENLMESLIEEQQSRNIMNAYNRIPNSEDEEAEDSEHSFIQMQKNSVMNNSDVSASNKVILGCG